jgi:phosphoglycerol transferase MdoB-like AlkP superfamily enzyme
MSDTSQGPGWWQASDGKWYPPEQAPGGGGGAGGAGGGGFTAGGGGELNIGDALSYGWNKFVQYIGQIILIVLVIFVVQAVFVGLSQIIGGSESISAIVVGQLIFVIGWIVGLILQAGLIRAGLAITRGEEPEVGMLFQTMNLGSFIVATILVGLLFFVGFLACCVGALVVGIFTLFYGYFVIDRAAQPVDSITSSFNLVKDNFGTVLLFAIVVVLLNIITCGLAVGVTQIATAYAYKRLTGQPIA